MDDSHRTRDRKTTRREVFTRYGLIAFIAYLALEFFGGAAHDPRARQCMCVFCQIDRLFGS